MFKSWTSLPFAIHSRPQWSQRQVHAAPRREAPQLRPPPPRPHTKASSRHSRKSSAAARIALCVPTTTSSSFVALSTESRTAARAVSTSTALLYLTHCWDFSIFLFVNDFINAFFFQVLMTASLPMTLWPIRARAEPLASSCLWASLKCHNAPTDIPTTISSNGNAYQVSCVSRLVFGYFLAPLTDDSWFLIKIVVQNAGRPPSQENTKFCSSAVSQEVVPSTSSMLIESVGYPKYPSSSVNCIRNVTVPSSEHSLDVYLTGAGFPGSGTAAWVL